MRATTLPPPFGASALAALLTALALCGPGAARDPVPAGKVLASDLALVPADAPAFLTLRAADVRKDALYTGVLEVLRNPLDEAVIRVPFADLDRVTLVLAPEVAIVRTAKPYDRKKVLGTLGNRMIKSAMVTRDGKVVELPLPTLQEKKIGNRSLFTMGEFNRWADAVSLVDRNVFVTGRAEDVSRFLGARGGQRSADLNAALVAAGNHSLVGYYHGASVRRLLAQAFGPDGRGGGGMSEKVAPKAVDIAPPPPLKGPGPGSPMSGPDKADKIKTVPPAKGRSASAPATGARRVRVAADNDGKPAEAKAADDFLLPPEMLPYKPLLQARYGLLTADLGQGVQATARVGFDRQADLERGETALKTALYVAGELVGYARLQRDLAEVAPALRPVQQALRAARVSTKGLTAQASVSLAVNAEARKAIAATVLLRSQQLQALNNLKQIGLALHSYHDAHGAFPPAAIADKAGKPLLSWRVAILPYIEQLELYKQFKLDEPWDSAHNKKLLAKMPPTYATAGLKTKEPYSTFYQVFTGPNTPWQTGAARPRITDFFDGSSNTFLVAEAGEAVPWTKPADLVVSPQKPLPKLGARFKGVFLVLLGDGSTRVVRRDVAPATLRLYIDPRDGNVVPDLDDKPPTGRGVSGSSSAASAGAVAAPPKAEAVKPAEKK